MNLFILKVCVCVCASMNGAGYPEHGRICDIINNTLRHRKPNISQISELVSNLRSDPITKPFFDIRRAGV